MRETQFTIPEALAKYLQDVHDGQDGCLLMITTKPGSGAFIANLVVTDPVGEVRANDLQPLAEVIGNVLEGVGSTGQVPVVLPPSNRIN